MSEGTKLGNLDDLDFDKSISKEKEELLSPEKGATKLGEVSDFEKSLYEDTEEPVDSNAQNSDAAEPTIEPKEDLQSKETSKEKVENKEEETLSEFEKALEESILDYSEGDLIKGTVRGIEKSGVLVDIGYKSDGYIPNAEFSNNPTESPSDVFNLGDEIDIVIDKIETKEGYTLLSRKKAMYELSWETLSAAVDSKEELLVYVMSKVDGGLIVSYNGIRGFIPLSQLSQENRNSADALLKTKITVTVINVDRRRRKIIFSNRGATSKALDEKVAALLSTIEIGQVLEGRVSSIKDFGAFIDLGGIEGLVHISELSWARVNHPSEVVSEGEDVKVSVLSVDHGAKKISLGMKQLQEDPWTNVADNYKVGQKVKGTVSRIVPFGAFIQLEKELEGLVHISELSDEHVDDISQLISVGQDVDVVIIKLQANEQKIGLSMKPSSVNTSATE